MPAKNCLSKEEKENLQSELKKEESPEIREIILMFILLNDGEKYEKIAGFIGCSSKSLIVRILKKICLYLG